jgi:FkbM family methyltransferase
LGRHLIYVDTRDFALAPHLMWDGFWEMWITQAMTRSLEPGMVAVDVGANFGYYTLLMADAVGPTGKVIAFEPNSRIARLLRWSGSVNGFRDRIVIDTRAAFSTTGDRLRFFIPDEHPMNASLYDPTNSSLYAGPAAPVEAGEFVDAETVRLDDVLPERVDVVKIDAEGAEREIWNGMTRTLERNDGIQIILEFNAARLGAESEPFLDEIEDMKFRLAVVDDDSTVKPVTRTEILSRGAADVVLYLAR